MVCLCLQFDQIVEILRLGCLSLQIWMMKIVEMLGVVC